MSLPATADRDRREFSAASSASKRSDQAPSALTTIGPAARQKLAEEAQLGLEIGLHVGVVIEMVAAEIGEGGGREAHAVEPALLDPVRGGFHREMRDAFARELVERAMQEDRIGRRQRAIGGARA